MPSILLLLILSILLLIAVLRRCKGLLNAKRQSNKIGMAIEGGFLL